VLWANRDTHFNLCTANKKFSEEETKGHMSFFLLAGKGHMSCLPQRSSLYRLRWNATHELCPFLPAMAVVASAVSRPANILIRSLQCIIAGVTNHRRQDAPRPPPVNSHPIAMGPSMAKREEYAALLREELENQLRRRTRESASISIVCLILLNHARIKKKEYSS
jgi:hypothetical protein